MLVVEVLLVDFTNKKINFKKYFKSKYSQFSLSLDGKVF